MRRALTVVVLAVGVGVYSYYQFRPHVPAPPVGPPPPTEQLVELDPDSPADRALEAYIAAVQKARLFERGNGDAVPAKDAPTMPASASAWLARFDARLPLLAADAREPILALQEYARTVEQQEKVLLERISAEVKDREVTAEKVRAFLLGPVVTLTHGFFFDTPGSFLLVDATAGKPAVLKRTARDGEVLYRLRWRQKPADIYESLILVEEEGGWKVLTPWGIGYGIKSIAADPLTGQGGESSRAREDGDWRAADFRKANAELAARLRGARSALEDLAAGKITAAECGQRLDVLGRPAGEAKPAPK